MRKVSIVLWGMCFACGVAFINPPHASATTLINENFQGASIANNLSINLTDNPGNTGNDNLGQWVDFPTSLRWGIDTITDSSDHYAEHMPQPNNNDLMFYGVDVRGMSLTNYSLSFNYFTAGPNSYSPRVYLYGMTDGVHEFRANLALDAGDGVSILDTVFPKSSTWTSYNSSGPIGADYDVLVFAIQMGGSEGITQGTQQLGTGFRGIDDVSLTATSEIEPIPEPATMLLLGTGLVGVAGAARRKKKNQA